MIRHSGFLITISGLGLAALLAPASGCSPSAIPDTSTHPADPQAPVGAAAPEVAETPDQPAPDAHGGHDAHPGHGAHAGHAAHAPSAAPAPIPPSIDPAGAPPIEPSGEALLAAEQDAYQRAKPVFDKYCARCHSSDGKKARKATLAHFSMDTYPFGGHHATEIGEEVREVLGVTGKKPTMPQNRPGIVQSDELALIVAWSEAFDRSHAAGLHQHGGAHGAGHQHGAASEPGEKHQHGAEKKPAQAPARGSDKQPAPEKKPDATHEHGTEHEGHQHGQHHGNGHDHGHH